MKLLTNGIFLTLRFSGERDFVNPSRESVDIVPPSDHHRCHLEEATAEQNLSLLIRKTT